MTEELSDAELQESKQHLMNNIETMFSMLMYYDRKEDDDLPMERIELLVTRGVVTPQEIVAEFQKHVFKYFEVMPP